MIKEFPWLTGTLIEAAQDELHTVITLLEKYCHLKETVPVTMQALLASCILPGQVIKMMALQYPETINIQYKKTATTQSIVTNADHLAQTLADSIMVCELEKNSTLDNVFFNSEEANTVEYRRFFAQKKYQAYFTLSSQVHSVLNNFYQRNTSTSDCMYFSNLDPLDGTACFKQWVKTQQTEHARWTVAHSFSEIASDGTIRPLATVVHNPVMHKTYVLDKTSNTYIVIDSLRNNMMALAEKQDKVGRLRDSPEITSRYHALLGTAV